MPKLRAPVLAGLLRWGAGTWLFWRVPNLRSPAAAAPSRSVRPPVSVVIPARDEAASLPVLLGSLAAQSRRPEEVIVVDDASADSTAEVAASLGAKVLSAGDLPPGWSGKAWACALGAGAASGETLVFLDADTWLLPEGLDRLLAEHHALGGRGLVTAAPFHRAAGPGMTRRSAQSVAPRRPAQSAAPRPWPYERLSAMCNLVTTMGTGAFTPLGGWTRAVGSFGPCLVCARAEYDSLGGHGALEDAMADDLSARFHQVGAPVRLVGGRGSVEYRMYPGGFAQLLEGWSKNLASGAAITRPFVLALVVAWVSGLITSAWRVASPGRSARSVAAYLAYGLQVEWMLRRIGSFGRGAGLAYPVPLAVFLGCFANSARLTFGRREVRWKGRAVRVGPRRG
ncbi:MAG: glycosyltransferase family 2 protein [Acidimicrobiales bacterium]